MDDDTEIKKAIRQLGAEVDLMLIAEYMDESLILLKVILQQLSRNLQHHENSQKTTVNTFLKSFCKS